MQFDKNRVLVTLCDKHGLVIHLHGEIINKNTHKKYSGHLSCFGLWSVVDGSIPL